MSLNLLTSLDVLQAAARIAPYLQATPVMQSEFLNHSLGHQIYFKVESLQKTGSFKIRGVINSLQALKEASALPKHVVAYSSGNHGLAVAYAARRFGIQSTIYLTKDTSAVKIQACLGYGAEVVFTDTRVEAQTLSQAAGKNGAYFLHPSNDDMVIAGSGTACLEALQTGIEVDAVFATCGGGGLVAGSLLASLAIAKQPKVYAGEPVQANDAARSYRSGEIVEFMESPQTIAEGAKTLAVTRRTFHYLKQIAGFIEVEEEDIRYWTAWLIHLLKIAVEPTAAVAMAAAHSWLSKQKTKQKILVIISGGNVDTTTYQNIWQQDYHTKIPAKIC